MREYLFRGKRLDNDEWVEGDLFQDRDLGTVHIQGFDYYSTEEGLQRDGYSLEVDPETVGQFTGLTDKNGRKIFEGDVCLDSTGWVFVVIWDSDNGRFLGRHSKPRGDTYICYVGRVPAVEIIGNRWDNPELLEGEK